MTSDHTIFNLEQNLRQFSNCMYFWFNGRLKISVNLNEQTERNKKQSNVKRNKHTHDTRNLHAVEYGKGIGEHNKR